MSRDRASRIVADEKYWALGVGFLPRMMVWGNQSIGVRVGKGGGGGGGEAGRAEGRAGAAGEAAGRAVGGGAGHKGYGVLFGQLSCVD